MIIPTPLPYLRNVFISFSWLIVWLGIEFYIQYIFSLAILKHYSIACLLAFLCFSVCLSFGLFSMDTIFATLSSFGLESTISMFQHCFNHFLVSRLRMPVSVPSGNPSQGLLAARLLGYNWHSQWLSEVVLQRVTWTVTSGGCYSIVGLGRKWSLASSTAPQPLLQSECLASPMTAACYPISYGCRIPEIIIVL